jgi:lipopolysaccharide/colanic/teichoic acid biosynthesis glycosyltransferase
MTALQPLVHAQTRKSAVQGVESRHRAGAAATVPLLVKSVLEQTLAWLTLLLLAPVLILLAMVVRLDSPGPALFRQVRIGQDGRPFRIVKFRTMVMDAEARVEELVADNAYGTSGPFFKVRNDPRITRVGCVLRKTSLDELPQLLNIALGHMSVIGPRPLTPVEVEALGPLADVRHRVKPGLTGLWQVSGRSETSWEQRVALDDAYVQGWTPMLDLRILARTVVVVCRGTGAY